MKRMLLKIFILRKLDKIFNIIISMHERATILRYEKLFGNISDCAIIRGNPDEVIKYRNKEIFWKLYNEGRFV